MSPNMRFMRFRLSTCIKAGRMDAPSVGKGWVARWLPMGLWAAWVVEAEVEVAGLGSVCWETEAVWAV